MTKVIGVRFRTAGKVYFFDPLQLEIKRGDHVIVETARGIEFGTVVAGVHEVEDDKVSPAAEACDADRRRERYRAGGCQQRKRKGSLQDL